MTIPRRDLLSFAKSVLVEVGLPAAHAHTVADSLVFANLRGIDSHGVVRLAPYVRRLEAGGTNLQPDIELVRDSPATGLVDGDNAMGQVTSMYAVEVAREKAKEVGVSFVGVRRSGHNGAASYYTHELAEGGMIGITTSNATPVMAAWGGADAVIGNNPLSIGVPRNGEFPLVFDAAMSKVAGGKVRLAAERGDSVPEGWIVDDCGNPTTDPNDILEGALLPLGEHKGFALAVMVEVLSSVITGAGMLHQNPFWAQDLEADLNVGHSFMAIDVGQLIEPATFEERLRWMVDTLHASPTADPSGEVLMPGEPEARTAQERRKNGIPISEKVWETLEELSATYGVQLPGEQGTVHSETEPRS